MQMTEQEYKDLMAHFCFLNDKVDDVYRRETDRVIERLEEEYKQYVKKYF
jgi:hypothetical protein